jgi:hypothetical protein
MKADRIGALVTALPFAVAGALLFAGWLWASRQRAPAAPPQAREASATSAPDRNGTRHAGADKRSR